MADLRHSFDEEFSYTGHWRLPDEGEAEKKEKGEQWIGTVTYRPQDGILLEVMTGWKGIALGRVPEFPPDKKRFVGSVFRKCLHDHSLGKPWLLPITNCTRKLKQFSSSI